MKTLRYHATDRHATWLELFFDLVFVACIGVITHHLMYVKEGRLDPHHAWLFPLEIIPVWWIWATHTLFSNRFDTDARGHRVLSLVIMFLMVTMSAFLGEALLLGFVVCYVAVRVIIAGMYFLARDRLEGAAAHTRTMGQTILFGSAIAGLSLLFENPVRLIVFFAGIALEMVLFLRIGAKSGVASVHRSHLVERVGLLSIILLGESVISLVAGLRGISWTPQNVTASVTGFLMLVAIWWIYFDSFDILERAKRLRHGFVLLYSHVLYLMGLGVLASVVRHAITSDIAMSDFRVLAVAGTILVYLGKQISYFVALPPYRFNILVNSSVCIAVTTASTFLPRPEYMLIGITLGLIFYSYSNFRWTLPKDVEPYLTKE